MIDSIGTPTLYLSFSLLVAILLAVDFFILKQEGEHRVSTREAALWSLVWVSIALLFGLWFWWYLKDIIGAELARARALEYLTGYLIEKSLAVDNVFVWITLFNFFAVPAVYQKRVLLYGVLGAIVLRAILIYVGALLLARFHWILYVFGAFLLYTGGHMLRAAEEAATGPLQDPDRHRARRGGADSGDLGGGQPGALEGVAARHQNLNPACPPISAQQLCA